MDEGPPGAAHRSGVAKCYQPGMDLLGSDLGFGVVNRFFNYSSELVGALGIPLKLHLCSKLLGVLLLNQLFDGIGRAAAELRCFVMRSKKIVSFDSFHGFLAILRIWPFLCMVECLLTNPSSCKKGPCSITFLKVIAKPLWQPQSQITRIRDQTTQSGYPVCIFHSHFHAFFVSVENEKDDLGQITHLI